MTVDIERLPQWLRDCAALSTPEAAVQITEAARFIDVVLDMHNVVARTAALRAGVVEHNADLKDQCNTIRAVKGAKCAEKPPRCATCPMRDSLALRAA